MSNTNNADLRWKLEGSYNTPPATTGWQSVRYTSHSLATQATFAPSDTIRSDGNIPDVARTNSEGGGSIEAEFAYGDYDLIYQYLLRDGTGWTAGGSPATGAWTAALDDPSNAIFTLSTHGLTVAIGDRVRMFGNTAAVNNAIWVVTAQDANTITVSDPDQTVDAAGTGGSIQVASTITNGVTEESIHIEAEYQDLSSVFSEWGGMVPTSWSLDMPVDGIITQSLGFQGSFEERVTATRADGSVTAVGVSPTMTAANDFTIIEFAGTGNSGAPQRFPITSYTHNIAVAARTNRIAGTVGPVGFGTGSVAATGTFQMFLEGTTERTVLFQDFQNNVLQTDMTVGWMDSNGQGYAITYPDVRLTNVTDTVSGKDADVFLDFEFQAFLRSDDHTVRVHRFSGS